MNKIIQSAIMMTIIMRVFVIIIDYGGINPKYDIKAHLKSNRHFLHYNNISANFICFDRRILWKGARDVD